MHSWRDQILVHQAEAKRNTLNVAYLLYINTTSILYKIELLHILLANVVVKHGMAAKRNFGRKTGITNG